MAVDASGNQASGEAIVTVPHDRGGVIESMFASDLAFLQDLYRRINQDGTTELAVTCPSCRAEVTVDLGGERLGES